MNKKAIALVAVIAIIASILAVPVGATMYYYEDFDTIPPNNDLDRVDGWKAYDSQYKGTGKVVDGYAMFSLPESRLVWEKQYQVTDNNYNHIAMFDIMVDDPNNRFSWQVFSNTTRSFYESVSVSANVWHTFMFVISKNGKTANLYHRKRDAAVNDPWTKVSTSQADVSNPNGKFSVRFDCSRFLQTGRVCIDNYRIFTGTNIIKEPVKVDTRVVNAVSDITAAGNLKANLELYSSDVVFNAANVLQPNKNAKLIMTALDKNNKLLDCSVENKSLFGGKNLLSSSLALSSDSSQELYFNNIKDGGYVGVYLWEGMNPLIEDAIELR